jgi:hypothetical protein
MASCIKSQSMLFGSDSMVLRIMSNGYEILGHYINRITSQHVRTNYALAINRPWPGFDRVVHHGST